jgi:hypothetical protein
MPVARQPKVVPGLLYVEAGQVIGVRLSEALTVTLKLGQTLGGEVIGIIVFIEGFAPRVIGVIGGRP